MENVATSEFSARLLSKFTSVANLAQLVLTWRESSDASWIKTRQTLLLIWDTSASVSTFLMDFLTELDRLLVCTCINHFVFFIGNLFVFSVLLFGIYI